MTALPEIVRCSSFDAFQSFMASDATRQAEINAFEADLLDEADSFTVPGRCTIFRRNV